MNIVDGEVADSKMIFLKGGNKMSIDDTFNGVKSGLTFVHAYVNTAAQAIGEEQAYALDTMACEALGAAQGKMIKSKSGKGEFDLRETTQVIRDLIEQGFGIRSDVISETPHEVVINIRRCPVYESMQALGMDTKAMEKSCRAGSIPFMGAITKQLNPELNYKLTKFRAMADDYCKETISLE